uniref:Uncharacterized protein n=1 Tax=Vespula pensylvanica TaxID=30213 RepID=A0A834UD87_VESPE|nr:hypothetical protein H0235_004822 [Vespula pensylvanica]
MVPIGKGGVLNAPNVIMRALGKYYGVGGVCGDDTTIVVDPFSVRGSLPDNSIIRYCRAEWQVDLIHEKDNNNINSSNVGNNVEVDDEPPPIR